MYCRAFPGLIGLLAMAFGAEHLPLRMLRLIPRNTVDAAASLDTIGLPRDVCTIIMRRALPGNDAAELEQTPPEVAPPQCYVRLFGGLEVTRDGLPVADEYWRKRKVRLLFAMLASRCGQDVPRDVLLERLWPDMDDERARRNFYVTWSAVKCALANGGPPSASASLVHNLGGVCRITRDTRVDLQDFDAAVVSLRQADAVGDVSAVLAAGHHLSSIYRGELLPGDIYEEWFAEIRERTKHDFCDAMMTAARAAEAADDADEALVFLRRAGVADPWREDIYQAMMRCQILAGQRSSAIETYIACRGRLVEDLGIDPSAETTRLYEEVLAMESDASGE
jgi:DNA-binding SARP family transcriptional activator